MPGLASVDLINVQVERAKQDHVIELSLMSLYKGGEKDDQTH